MKRKSDELLSKLGASLEKPAAKKPHRGSAAGAAAPEPPPPPPPAPEPAPAAATAPRRAAAEEIVNRFLPYALGAGAVPVPLLDLAAITGVQLKLIADLAACYGQPFAPEKARAIVAALLGGVGSVTLAASALGSLVKIFPGGGLLGATGLPVTAGAVTYALGHVFISHFESGGTLLDFDQAKAKRFFAEQLAKGRAAVDEIRTAAG
ncbi:MAG TPA: DUF697 domain-containing protein [Opitutaceae bacterium]|nr:DUF697 domain-containing protein [Opitutaceae bacterium]